MKVSIVIPVFNEEKTLAKILEQVKNVPVGNWEKEIIVVDDGSTDNSKIKIQNAKLQLKIKNLITLEHAKNQGKGAAIKTALDHVQGDYVMIQDADLEYDPNDWLRLLKEVGDKETRVIYGSRNINPHKKGYPHYVLGVKILTFAVNLLFRTHLTDVYTCYKLFPSSLIKSMQINSSGFEFEAEVTAKILKKGIPIKEVAINYNPRKFKEGKKIRFSDGLKGLWTIIKYKIARTAP
jgi:glycosyltransferase involved in cell wall biosynthesis